MREIYPALSFRLGRSLVDLQRLHLVAFEGFRA